MANTYTWGVNGHPLTVAGSSRNSAGGGQTGQDLLFWDGGSLLFTMEQPSGGAESLNDVKIGALAEYTPLDGYQGVTFYDRRPDGSIGFCHNHTGAEGTGNGDPYVTLGKWGGGRTAPCSGDATAPNAQMPQSVVFNGSWAGQLSAASPPVIGAGWSIGEIRTDGFEDGVSTIQGVRAYDPTPGQWTTPDAYAGSVHDPMTQKSYIWNGNNPISYEDPTGFDIQMGGNTPAEIQKAQDDYLNFLVQLTNEGDTEALSQVKIDCAVESNDYYY